MEDEPHGNFMRGRKAGRKVSKEGEVRGEKTTSEGKDVTRGGKEGRRVRGEKIYM